MPIWSFSGNIWHVRHSMACMVSSRKRQEKKGIHLIWVTHDLFDPRIVSRQGVRDQVNRYMRTVFKEEPLDPSLEILHDEHSW